MKTAVRLAMGLPSRAQSLTAGVNADDVAAEQPGGAPSNPPHFSRIAWAKEFSIGARRYCSIVRLPVSIITSTGMPG